MPDSRTKLYQALSSDFDLGSQDEFNSKMDNPESRKKLYAAVSNDFDLGSFEEFEGKVASVKKKASSNWGSDSQPKDTATSLVSGEWTKTKTPSKKVAEKVKTTTKTPNYFPKVDTNGLAPGEGTQFDYNAEKAKEVAKSNRIKELETSFYASTKDNTDDAVAEQRLQDRKANKGFWNTAEDLTKSAYNKVVGGIASITDEPGIKDLRIDEDPLADEKKQALQEAKKNKVTLSEIKKNARAEEIFKQKEKDNLFIDRANSYLDNLDVKDKDILEQSRADKAVHLQEENLKKFKVVSAMETVGKEKIKEYQDVEKQLQDLKEKNQAFPKELYDKYVDLSEVIKGISGNIQRYSDQIQKNKADLGTAQQEFDLFKRGYGDMDNFMGNIIATTGELANGLLGSVNYALSLSPSLTDNVRALEGQGVVNKIAGVLEEYRGALRKPVESVESAEGFVNYASDLVANQIPVLLATSTGVAGLATLGVTKAGQTFTKINQEVLEGKASYTPLQMAAIPALDAGFEMISEVPTLSILKKGSRVIAAAAKGEIDLVKQSGGELFKSYVKDFGKEFGGEHVTNIGQNFNARYVQGKEEVGLLDNTGRVSKDTAFLTTLLQGSPHVAGAVLKVFQSNSDLGVLDENSRKIIEFSKQLNTEGLTDTEKKVIQKQIDKVTYESSKIVANTIGKIGDMPTISYDEIVSLNSQAGKIKAQAKEIKDGKLPNKEVLLTSLGQDYKELQTKRNGLIDGSITPFDLLSGNEQAKRLTEASREITKRDNPDGTKAKFEVKSEDAKELASENYLKEIKEKEIVDDKQVEQTPTPEAQPQAEVPQQAEAEKVETPEAKIENDRKQSIDEMWQSEDGRWVINIPKEDGVGYIQVNNADSKEETLERANKIYDERKSKLSKETPTDNNSKLDINKLEVSDNFGEITIGVVDKENQSIKAYEDANGEVIRFKTKEEAQAKLDEIQKQNKATPPVEDVVATSVENDNGIKQVKSFKKGEGGTLGVFEDADGKLYKSIVPTSKRIENDEVKFDADHNNPTEEFDILTENQDLPNLPKIGKLVDTNEGKAFEIEKLNEVDKLTYDEIRVIQGTIAKLNERGVFVNDKNTVMRRDNGEVVLVDLSTAQKSDSKYDAPELISQNIIDLLNPSDKGRFNAENRAKNILEIQEGLDIAQDEKSEYTYLLTQRPPSIGTHPIDNISGEIKEVKLGNRVAYEITYNKELSKNEIDKFELTPKLDEYDSGKVFVKDSGSNKIYLVVENVAENDVEITMYIAGKEKTTNYTYRQASKLLNDYTPVNEKPSKPNPPADGNVPLGASNVGESGITEQESPAKEGVSKPVDGGEGKGDASVGKIDSTTKALVDFSNKKEVKFSPDDKVIFTAKDGKEFEVNFRGYNGESKSVIVGARGSGINQMEVDSSQLRKKSSSDKLSVDERNKLISKIDLEKTKYFGKGLDGVSDTKLIELFNEYPQWGKLSENEKQNIRDFQSATTPLKRQILQEYGEDAPNNIVEKIKEEQSSAILNILSNENYSKRISEAYHEAKKDGSNPELVKAVEDAIGKPAETPQPKSKGDAEVEKKSVTLPSLDDIADFINQTYLKDEQPKPTTESNSGAKKRSSEKNIDSPESAGKSKTKEVVLDENGYVIVSKKGKTPLEKRKFKGDRKEAVSITPSDARSVVLSFFAKGGKIASSYFTKPGELKARNNGINGIATTKAKDIDSIAHDLWQSQENKVLKLDTEAYKGAIEEVVRSHNNIQDVVDSLLKYGEKEIQESPKERQENFQAYNELQAEEKASDEEMQKALNVLDQLSEAEIIELTNDKEKGFEDYLKDLEERQVTYNLGPFSERGTLQADGSIISENGDYISKESVKNVKQVNPKIQAKKEISKDSPELKEVNAKLVKANEKLRIAKDALDRKAKSLDKELLKDNEDIFGERKNQNENKLFDERVDGNARNKATEKERKAIIDAQNEIKSLKEAKAKIENGEITPTSEMNFETPVGIEIKKQIDNGNITPKQVEEFVNDDRKATEIEPIVEAIEIKAKSNKKVELKQAVIDVENEIERKPTDRGNDRGLQKYSGKPLAQQENKRPGIVVQAESKMPTTKDFLSENYEIDEVQKQGVNSALSLFESGGKSFLLADGTGVGKTRQILVIAKEYLNKFGGKVLIISENTTILEKNFANDAKALGIDMNDFEYGTYNDLRTGKKGKGNYGLVIYDEAHNLKNQESGKAIAAGNIKSTNNMYVTATPMDTIGSAVYFISEVSGVTEEQAYNMLGLNVKKQKDAITGQEVKIVTLQEGVAPADIKRNIVKIREEIISKGAMLRREYPFYGEFVEDKIELNEEQSNEQDEIESSWDDRIEYESVSDDGRVNFRKKMNLSGQKSGELSRWSESTKIKYTFAQVVKEIKAGKKVVVIAEGVNETTITAIDKVVPGFLSELSKMLKKEGFKVAEIFGKSDKVEANDLFQANEVDVVLGTAKSASTGIDLDDQNGDSPRVLFMVTPNYSGNVFQQILGRVSRRNTKSPAQVRLLFNESNIDARRKQIVNGKLQTLKAIQEGVIDDDIEIDIQEAPIPSADVKINLEGITLEDISAKAFVVKGDTKPIKHNIKAIGGRYNPKYGWMFPMSRKAEVQEMLNKLNDVNNPIVSESQQLKEKVNNEVDRIAQQVKDLLPGINDPDLHTQGFSQDQLIDLIATAVKKLISAGIDVNEAIKQVVDSIKAKFGEIDIDIDAVYERVSSKKEVDNDFKSKPGKKSVLNRAFEGGNSDAITAAIEKHGLDYRIENQEEAKKLAEDFVNEVGSAVALEAVRNNQIKGAEKAFVYSTIIDNLLGEIEATTDLIERGKLEEEHAKIIADITNELSQEGTDAGRFISALNKVYNSSKLRYNLKTQIDSHKASNNGEISDEVLEKFTQADKRIKELEKLIEEAEAKVKKAEEESSIKNIQEDIERKKQLANKNKSGLTPREQTRKKELSNKFFGRFNDASGVITALADPEFREYLGLTFKQAKGDLDNFTKRVLSELGKVVQKHIPQLFEEGKKSTPSNSKSIAIGKSGKLSIPAQLFRDYVEAGETDIDVIAAKIKEDIAEEFPDADVRDIRDALTGYGKQINPTKDEVSIEISRLKRLGKLISAYEDASSGINPLKSGLKQPKPTQEMRDLKKEINRLIKENGLDAVDLEKQWASALDKVKSQLKNQIEDLDKQIANGEKRKIERTTITFDDEATSLKAIRDAKKQILDDMVGKPELTEEQLIARAEKSLQTSIDKLQKEITDGQIEYKEKPTVKQSQKLDELRKQRKDLVDTKNQMREESGLVEAKRLSNAKKRVKAQIDGLNQRIADKDFSKKEPKPLIEDSELSQLRAEKIQQQEIYDAQKYADELKNRSKFQKWSDAFMELWNVPRILKATGELSTVLIQGGILTTSRKLTNPKALGKIMKELFISLGSAKSAAKYEALIKAHPKYPLAIKAKLALTNPDYKSDVREEQYSGDYANLFWDLPFVLASYNSRLAKAANKERAILGDVIKKVTGIGTPGTDKLSIRQQWKNVNPFVALERGGTLYMNTLRMEEFVRGTEMLSMEGKNEVDHLQDYKLTANAINSMSGRANLPAAVATSSKFLAAVFFSARNAISIINQVNPIYYGYLHFGSTDGIQIKKTSVANKLALTNMMRFVTITGLTMLAIKAAAGKDDDDEDIVQIETDPNSSDFMKMKIGDIRFDGFHGMTTMIVLISRLITENVKSTSDGKTTKLGEKRFGPQSRLDLIGAWARNKFAPSMAITANYLDTHEEVDPETGDEFRQTPFGKKFTDDESLDMTPMYWSAVKEIQAEDPGAMAEFLTVVSVFGWNTSVYEKASPKKDKFKEKQEKRQEKADLTEDEKAKIKANNSAVKMRSIVNELENELKSAESNTPYYDSKGKLIEHTPLKIKTIKERIATKKKRLKEKIKKAGDLYKEPEE